MSRTVRNEGYAIKRNPYAKALNDKLFNVRIVKAKKGKGSYDRMQKNIKTGIDAYDA